MTSQKRIKQLLLVTFILLSMTGVYLGFRGASELFASIDVENVTSSTKLTQPLESKIASYLNISVGIAVIVYMLIFKEKKTNIFWLLLGPIGVIIFSVKKLLTRKKGDETIAI